MNINKAYYGAEKDNRSELQKAQDYQADEVASAAPVEWKEKTVDEWKKLPTRDQDGSSTCVAQVCTKLLGIENLNEEGKFIVFSARDIYERRVNKPNSGMYGPDALKICSKFGATTEERLPSQKMSEAEIVSPFVRDSEDIKIAETYRAGGYVTIPIKIDRIADIIQNQKKGVLLFIYANWEEWTDVPTIKDRNLNLDTALIRHGVTGVDTTLWKGEKAIVIDDSWGRFYGFNGQRVLTESFLKERCYFAGYLLDLSNKRTEPIPKPKFKFTKPLFFGLRNNEEVKMLQDMLKYEELFPQKIESTGNYLQITGKAVRDWQVKHGIMDFANEKDTRKVRFGSKSVSLANKLYS